ncbi:hypothetical protein ACH79_15915 [Bradyrhizobium sp. CCBAU 051011]|nr:hypothetical protein ACH79_15915 [Bradyrhizobium sp. CCBAU 051011]
MTNETHVRFALAIRVLIGCFNRSSDAVSLLMKIKQPRLDSEWQDWCRDLVGINDIADVIELLRNENDGLRQLAELLSTQTEYLRRSLPIDWRPRLP